MAVQDQEIKFAGKMAGARIRRSSSRNYMKSSLCIPRLRTTDVNNKNTSNSNKRLSPMSLLDRFRDAVYHLIMITALSKNNHKDDRIINNNSASKQSYYPVPELHHSESVAECIDFIKKSASTTDYARDSISSTTSSRSSSSSLMTDARDSAASSTTSSRSSSSSLMTDAGDSAASSTSSSISEVPPINVTK